MPLTPKQARQNCLWHICHQLSNTSDRNNAVNKFQPRPTPPDILWLPPHEESVRSILTPPIPRSGKLVGMVLANSTAGSIAMALHPTR